jgi:hypothetical protein
VNCNRVEVHPGRLQERRETAVHTAGRQFDGRSDVHVAVAVADADAAAAAAAVGDADQGTDNRHDVAGQLHRQVDTRAVAVAAAAADVDRKLVAAQQRRGSAGSHCARRMARLWHV